MSDSHPTTPRAFAGVRVLLAEDEPMLQLVGRLQLESLGCEVVLARDGNEALRVIEEGRLDLVLMDCQMPEVDGYEVTRRLRERERVDGVTALPVVALTSNTLPGDRKRCLDAGMNDYLPKPVPQKQLAEAIERWSAGGSHLPAGTDSGK